MSNTLNRIAAKALCTLSVAMLTFAGILAAGGFVRADDPVPVPVEDYAAPCLLASCRVDQNGNYQVGKSCTGHIIGSCTCYQVLGVYDCQ
ncbi:hypothetical protein GobsT_66120 [Gemmata obscuriglobus]|uniref:EGF-like domain-containing protein n=1 Tax=Gemmata obscuriglobus TaxID=114 RepID=A0A2Z3H278_9BACT|nr:hypothetical protein [Gemmata obscuriglobus]AWM35704.1 hypothetical protein C1280_00800 [Gemmata obscuriglobus]QEG31768.1 hypothetical protein GobsT_66120 [Gemmata obscuriglobus]VTS11114.1 unnamed protein product [Gemmata obscuriglobus UQM 2246]